MQTNHSHESRAPMATTTVTLVDIPTATSTALSQPPIVYFYEAGYRFLTNVLLGFVGASAYVWPVLKAIVSPFVSLFSALSSPILYLLSPLFLLVNIILSIFVYAPYNFLTNTMHALYPVYAFVFITVVLASVVGMSARLGTYVANMLFLYPAIAPPVVQEAEVKVERDTKPMPAITRVPRRVHIKIEDIPPTPLRA